jgi:Na+/proline symporter
MNVPRKYPVLRVIAFILKVLAWIVLAAGIIGMIALLSAGSGLGSDLQVLRPLTTAGAFAVPLMGIWWFVLLFGFGSILSLLVDIEEKTRELATRPPE